MRRTTTAGSSRRSAPHRDPAPVLVGTLVLAVLAALAGCTSTPSGSPDVPTPQSGVAVAVAAPQVSAPVTRVAGRLPDRRRLALRRDVEALVADYVTAAFLDPTASASDALPGFSAGAARLARSQGAVLSRADLERSGDATVRLLRAEAPVSVLAPRGRPAGATARLDLVLLVTRESAATSAASPAALPPATAVPAATTDGERVRLQGRLLLTPVGDGWRVFGFDVRRSDR